MKKAEILAPAGSFDALVAAVRCGANAVYLGGRALNARRNAANFSDEELVRAIEYCHKRNVKLYVTVNTLVSDNELPESLEAIRFLCESGADALIVQDIGLASLIKKMCPDMPLHASTQMSIQSIEGIKILKEAGFSRAVLPRELSKKEIEFISSRTDMELEYFVHGALCMCLSGQCLMSSMLGGRSGNRGLCAQPCRLPFGVNGKGGNNLSLKDLSLIDRIDELTEAGICSLKIEGRMKRPEYVAAAVTACRNAIENTDDPAITTSLKAVFSRSGFTSGYFDGKLGKDMFGIRTKDDVENSAPVLSSLSHLYDNENPLLTCEMSFEMKQGEKPVLTMTSGENSVRVTSDTYPSPAQNKPTTPDSIKEKLLKLGGTQFLASQADIYCDDNLYFPVSAINAMRRDAVTALESKIAGNTGKKCENISLKTDIHPSQGKKLFVRYSESSQIDTEITGIDRVIIPIDTPSYALREILSSGAEVSAEIPVNVYSNAPKYKEKLLEMKKSGVNHASCCNLDGIEIAKSCGMKFSAFFGMNVFNSHSLDYLKSLGATDALVSCEMKAESISTLGSTLPRGVLVYGRIPLMVTRNCPISNKLKCSECKRESFLVDRMGISFPVRCSNGCSFILNSRPISLFDKLNSFRNTDFDLIYFTIESKEECNNITGRYFGKEKAVEEEITRGLYFRSVL